ncbi:Ig-like domain-containing protein [Shewanella sp. HL-SH4]|uniref:Ig-like domain-containing protein n=1 Tax=Shewanella sp. HL-SH4 TaxID=3436240 RepID=UPI003EBFB5F8
MALLLFSGLALNAPTAHAANGTLTFTSNTGIVGGVAQDGQGGSTDLAGVTIQIHNIIDTAGTTGGNITWQNTSFYGSGAYTALTDADFERKGMSIKSSDGSEFQINSFQYLNWGESSTTTITVKGYRDGSEVATVDFEGYDVGYNPTTVSLNSTFDNVDQVRLYISAGGYKGDQSATAHSINNIVIADAVLPAPTITSSTYNAATGALVVTGTNFTATAGATNDVVANKFTLTGEGGATYTLTNTADVEISSATSFTLTLSAIDRASVNVLTNKNNATSTSGTSYNLAGAAGFIADAPATADLTGNAITVSSVPLPTISTAAYNANTGVLTVSGTGFSRFAGATNDIVANKFTLHGEAGASYTLTDTSDVEITSNISFLLTFSATDKAAYNLIANKNGGLSTDISTYYLEAADDWAAGADSTLDVEDSSGNNITVTNVPLPTISSALYSASTGVLAVTGAGFTSSGPGGSDDIIANKFTLRGEAGTTYTLTDTANVEVTSGTSFTFTLSATDKSGTNALLNKNGTSSVDATTYNLAAAEDWAPGADSALTIADLAGNGITVSNVFAAPGAPTIGTATAGDTQVSVTFSAPGSDGGSAITSYTVTSSPGGASASGGSSPLVVTGLTNGQAYTFTVTATNGIGTGSASAASNSAAPKAPQTITFGNPGTQNFGTTPTLSATATSGLTPTFSSTTTGVCTITSGGALTFVTAGTCSVDADEVGSSSYLAAATVTRSFNVNAVVAGAPTAATATAGDAQATVSFTAPAFTGGAAITGYTVTSSPGALTGTGAGSPIAVTGLTNGVAYTFTVTATNSAGVGAASGASSTITPKAAQTITFSNPGAQNFGTTPTLSASATSSLTPTFTSSTTGVCTITSGGVLSFVTTGSCIINADEVGNSVYLPAAQVSQSFSVTAVVAGAPTIGTATAGDAQASVSFSAPASNGGAAITSYTVTSSPGGLTASGASSPLTVAGLTNGIAYTFTVTATNSAGVGAASSASGAITPKAAQTITFSNPGAQNFGTTPTLSATATSSLTPTFSSTTTGVCTVTSVGNLSFISAGTCTINANEAGNGSYLAAAQVSQSFSVNAAVAGAPTIGTATAGDAQASVSFTAPTSTGGAAITGYIVTSSPGGLTANGAASPLTVTGLTNGIAYTFAVQTINSVGAGNTSVASNSVIPNGAPVITGTPILTIDQDTQYSFTPNAVDTATDTLTFSIVNKPLWATFNTSTGTLSGTPSIQDVGVTNGIVISVSDGTLSASLTAFNLTVINTNKAPTITSTPITSIAEGSVYSYTFSATDVDPGDTLTLSALTLPSWLSFNVTTGVLNGTATNEEVGTHAVTLRVADTAGLTADQSFSITVTNVNDAPIIGSTPITSIAEGSVYSYTFLATDADSGDTLTLNAVVLPSWLSFNVTTGVLSGTPTSAEVGTHEVTLRAIDVAGLTADQSFSITVTNVNDAPIANSASVTLSEDSSVMIILTAEDLDNDQLTYDVVNMPVSGTLEQHGTAWLYTPEKDFNGKDSISFTAKDAELTSEAASITINVTAINDEPLAVDDSYSQSLSTDNSYTLAVLDNDSDVDGDTLTIDGAAADVGSVQIVASQLKYLAPTDFVGPVTLRYSISDGNKGRSNAKVQLLVTGENSADLPVITVPADITANATGLFTKLKLGVATAVDKAGNKLAVSLVNTQQLFAPGEHLAYWKATDSQGRSAIKPQKVTVKPLISISRNQAVAEGSEAHFSVFLNGPSPQYPVSIPYTVSGSSDGNDHDLVDGVFEITFGLSASFSVNVFDDGITEADEELIIGLDPSLNLSGQRETRLLITEANIAPTASIEVTQSNEPRTQLSKQDGKVYIKAKSQDVNLQNSLTEVWSTGVLVLESDADGSYFDPSALDAGIYPISLVVTDDGTPQLSTEVQLTLLVKDSLPELTGNDSDGDLIPDNQEGFADTDGDGIADYLDGINECNVLQEQVSSQQTFLAESEPGVCLHLGNAALSNGAQGLQIPDDNFIPDPIAFIPAGGLFDFVIGDLPKPGMTVSIVIPQIQPIPANGVYRKFMSGRWVTFVENANNSIHSSQGSVGYCQPPGAAEWQPGLIEGYHCVQLTIEDGGPNDDDGLVNSTVSDPGGVAAMLNNNHLPVANADSASLSLNQSIDIDVLANDTDIDGDTLSVQNVTSDFGDAVILANQQISYTPDADFIGIDVLSYSISDGQGGTSTSKLTVTVIANSAPTTVDDIANTDDRTSLLLNVLSNDSDIDGDNLTLVSGAALQGAVSIESNQLRYTPKQGFEGVDTVSYLISDGAGGEASGQVLVTIKAYQEVVIDNQSGGGSLSLYGLVLLAFGGLVRRGKWLAVAISSVLLTGVTAQANAAEANSWYLDGFVGQAYADSKIQNWQYPNDTEVTDVDDSDTALGLSAGYQWNNFLAVELGYSDFGSGTAQLKGSTLSPEAYQQALKSVTPILADGITLGLRFTLVEHQDWRFEIPVGLFRWNADIASQMNNNHIMTELSGTDWYIGMQFHYQMTKSWSLGLGYQYVDIEPNDILTGQLRLRYHF